MRIDMERLDMKTSISRTVLILCLAFVGSARAQNFAIDWFTIDGGGGTSTGGVFAISGTIGQPDGGVMTNGNYALLGGFWAVASIPPPAAPRLNIERLAGGQVRVFWGLPADSFVLDGATNLLNAPNTVWTQVAFPYDTNATHISITVPMPGGRQFYRLRRSP